MITYRVAAINKDGNIKPWSDTMTLDTLLDHVDYWRSDKRDPAVVLIVTESFHDNIVNIQFIDKESANPDQNEVIRQFNGGWPSLLLHNTIEPTNADTVQTDDAGGVPVDRELLREHPTS